MQDKLKKIIYMWENYSYLIAFILVVIIATIITDGLYIQPSNLLSILKQSSIKGILALGMTIIILIGAIDLSVGSVIALAGGLSIMAVNATGSSAIGFLCAIAVTCCVGFIDGTLVSKLKMAPFIVTLGMMAIARSLILQISSGGVIKLEDTTSLFSNIATSDIKLNIFGDIYWLSYQTIIFIALTIFLIIVMEKTSIGVYIKAVGSNEKSSRIAGISTDKVIIGAFIFAGFFVGVSSILAASQLNSVATSNTGVGFELDAIAAVAIGGTSMNGGKGKVIGTFFGILILTTIVNMMTLAGLDAYIQGVVKGLVIIAAVGLQSGISILKERV